MKIFTFDHHVYLHFPGSHDEAATLRRIESAITQVLTNQGKAMTDLTNLQNTVDALDAKVDEANTTLAGLAQEVVDLKNSLPVDQQPLVDAIAAKAQAILDKLTAAEDAADDQLPATPAP